MPFSSLISQSKCSMWSQVMFSGVGLLIRCLNLLQLQIEFSLPNLILKNAIKWVPWMVILWNNTLHCSPLFLWHYFFISWFDLRKSSVFSGGALKSVRGGCVSVHRHSHSGVYYWNRNLWSFNPLRTASSMRDDGTSETSAVRWHHGLIICFTLSRYFIAQIAIWTRDDVTHHHHRENWSERCWAVHWSLHHSQCKG